MEKHVLGHIDCPTCGAARGMRITHDKNQEPFGYCEAGCGQQLRIGGNPARVRMFVSRFPFAVKPGAPIPVTVTVPKQEPAPAPAPKAKATFADALKALGV